MTKRSWFLSYNSQDLLLMRSLRSALKDKDSGSEVFFAPDSLRAGGYWLPKLAEAMSDSTAFVLLVGENGLGPWQIIEYYEALDRRVKGHYPVILVLRADQTAPGLPFLRQLHWIVTPDPASEDTIGRILAAADSTVAGPGKLWKFTAPYRGLASMVEADGEFFFGRDAQTLEVLKALNDRPDRILLLLGNSGVGKSSLAQAGVLAALRREALPSAADSTRSWPHQLKGSRGWCYLKIQPGSEPLRALVEPFLRTWQYEATDPLRETRQLEWVGSLLAGRATVRGLLDATQERMQTLGLAQPPAFFLYVDQGEELYVRAAEEHRRRFSELLAEAVTDRRFRVLMSLRTDFFGVLQADEPLYAVHYQINVPPLREAELRDVVSRPAQLLSASFESKDLATDIARRTAEESTKDTGALPLLSYLLDDMWSQMVVRDDGILRLPPQALELGGVLAERADHFLASHPRAEEHLRRILTLKLATVREDGDPTRRRALRSEFSSEEWGLVRELTDHPHRLLVTATPESGETYAEVAHEAIFRRWSKLREWVETEREFLVWKAALERDRCEWEKTPPASKQGALLMGLALAQAQAWRAKRAQDLPRVDIEFIDESIRREALDLASKERLRRRVQWIGVAALALVTAFATFAFYQWREVQDAKDVAIRSQGKYDVIKAAIVGNERKLAIEERHKVLPERRRTAGAILADLRANYQLLDSSSFDSLLKHGVDAKRILWFDTEQENNESEAEALRKLGFLVVQTVTIPDTVASLAGQKFDLIITHYGFKPDKEKSEAYELRNAIAEAGLERPPTIIYTIGAKPEFACIVQQDGFYDEVDMPAQLIEVAVRSASYNRARPRCLR
jgi:hypothetical protein